MVGYDLIRSLQTNLRSSCIERPIQKCEPIAETPRKHYILIVGFNQALQDNLTQAINSNGLEFAVAENEEQALNLLRANFKQDKICDLAVLSEQLKNPYEIGALTDILRSRSMCGEVAVIKPKDELRARKLGMTPATNVPDLVNYLMQKDKEHYSRTTQNTTSKTLTPSSRPDTVDDTANI